MSGDNLEVENADLKKRLAAVREVLGRVTNELEAHLGGPQDQNEEEAALLHDARLALTDAFDLDELRLHRLHIDGAGVEMEVSSQKVVQGLAALMARTLDDLGAKNYVQQELSLSTSEFVLLVQRRAGKTPHTLRLEAEAERDDLKKRLAAADEQLRIVTERVEYTQNVADREHESVMRLSRANDEVAAALRACEAKLAVAERKADKARALREALEAASKSLFSASHRGRVDDDDVRDYCFSRHRVAQLALDAGGAPEGTPP